MKSVFLSIAVFGVVLYAQGQGFHGNAPAGTLTPAQLAQNETNRLTGSSI